MKQNWIFDFDGTLVNTDGFFQQSLDYALKPFDVTAEENFIEVVRHRHPSEIFDHLLGPNDAKEALRRLAEMGKDLAEKTPLFEGVREVLETLKAKDHSVSIWTGRDRASTIHILEKRKALHYFDKVVSGTCVQKNKPQLDGLEEISSFYKKDLKEFAMIGDHHHDIEPANQVGSLSIHAQWKQEPHQLPGDLKADKSFDCLQAFHRWLVEST